MSQKVLVANSRYVLQLEAASRCAATFFKIAKGSDTKVYAFYGFYGTVAVKIPCRSGKTTSLTAYVLRRNDRRIVTELYRFLAAVGLLHKVSVDFLQPCGLFCT